VSSVVDLAKLSHTPSPGVVEALEQLLESAKRGEIRGLAAVTSCVSGEAGTVHCLGEGSNVFVLLGGLRLLEREILEAQIQPWCNE
jgi:hypothetical protein